MSTTSEPGITFDATRDEPAGRRRAEIAAELYEIAANDECGPRGLAALPKVGRDTITSLAREIEDRGFACLPDYIAPETLAEMRGFVADAIATSHGEYVGFTGHDAVAGTPFAALAESETFRALIRGVYQAGTGCPPPESDFYQVLRCLSGRSGQRHAYNFHYDSYVVTALVPVEIPKTGRTGDLVMLPNTRRIRGTYYGNLVDKVFLDNRMAQWILKVLTQRRMLPLVRIKLVPGNLYLFWGYRSIHTNEACDPDKIRATALYHYVNPHADSRMRAGIRGAAPV